MRLDSDTRDYMRMAGFACAVVIAKDVSVCMVGSVESVFTRRPDAEAECSRLNEMYRVTSGVEDSHIVEEL